ncbi:MAG: hypothetical protein PWP08_520 [Methanofollis sp.]|nr:hypothetical protein [Methanofollis sp.]
MNKEDVRFDEQIYEVIFESTGDGLVVVDRTSLILRANRRFLSMAGYERSEVEGTMHWSGVVDDPDLTPLAVSGPDGNPVLHNLHLKRKDGSLLEVAATVEPVGEHGAFTVSVIDISREVRAIQTLHRRDAVLDAINSMAGLFINSIHWEDVIVRVLRDLCEATGARRVYLFKNTEDPETGDLLLNGCYEWNKSGRGGAITDPAMHGLSYRDAGVLGWVPILSAGKIVFTYLGPAGETLISPAGETLISPAGEIYIDPAGKTLISPAGETLISPAGEIYIGPAGENEQKNMEALGVTSEVIAPIYSGDRWWGFIGFDETQEERHWAVAEIDAIGAAAGIIGSTVRREENAEELLAFLNESALRLKNPIALVRDNLALIYEDIQDGTDSKESIMDRIKIQIANANQIVENLRTLTSSATEGRPEIPEAFRRFLNR